MTKTASESKHALQELYCGLMEEVKIRCGIILSIAKNEYNIPDQAGYELFYLQLRMICEVIALACLVAHGDIPATRSKRLLTTWKPHEILAGLETLHPDFYPQPVDEVIKDGKLVQIVANLSRPHLSKAELLRLYGECGEHLHRGGLQNVRAHLTVNYNDLVVWHKKIVGLLNRHFIPMIDPKDAVYVVMQAVPSKKVTLLNLGLGHTLADPAVE